MDIRSDLYQDVAHTYIAMIKKYSLEVGITIEQIHATFGARAAVLATLVVTLQKMEVMENYQNHDSSIYAMIVRDYPEALTLVNQAVERSSTWAIPGVAAIDHKPAGSPGTDTLPSTQSIYLSPNLQD